MRYTRDMICKELDKVENYALAKQDNFHNWILHHKQGLYMSTEEMEELGWYTDCPADCLMFIKKEEHWKLHHKSNYWKKFEMRRNYLLNGYTYEHKLKTRKPTEFNKKYWERFHQFKSDNFNQWQREYRYYKKHNKVSWEG